MDRGYAARRAVFALLTATIFALFTLGAPVGAVQPMGDHMGADATAYDAGYGYDGSADMTAAACFAHTGCTATPFTAPVEMSLEPVGLTTIDFATGGPVLIGRTSNPATKPPIA